MSVLILCILLNTKHRKKITRMLQSCRQLRARWKLAVVLGPEKPVFRGGIRDEGKARKPGRSLVLLTSWDEHDKILKLSFMYLGGAGQAREKSRSACVTAANFRRGEKIRGKAWKKTYNFNPGIPGHISLWKGKSRMECAAVTMSRF